MLNTVKARTVTACAALVVIALATGALGFFVAHRLSGALVESTTVAKAVRNHTGTIRSIDKISGAIANSVEAHGAATGEIAQNAQQAAVGTQDVSSNIATVRTAADRTGQVSAEVVNAAAEFDRQAETLRQVFDGFIAEVRAA